MNTVQAVADKTKRGFRRLITFYHPQTLREKGIVWFMGLGLVTAAAVMVILSFVWGREPGTFDVRSEALQMADFDEGELISGYTTTAVIAVADTLLHKPGGYLSNDVTPPSLFMNNIKNWEFGVLLELRDVARALRNDFARARTQSSEDPDLRVADVQFHFNHQRWMLPSAENEYRKGIAALHRYRARLTEGERFLTRADNLNAYLATVEKRLGNIAHRLSANVRQLRFEAAGLTPISGEIAENTPWMEIDNVFFEARGYTWAVLHILKGIEVDFQQVLQIKNGETLLRRIIHKLENTQQALWSPMLLNNSGFGILTNHSLILASYLSRANAAIIDLRLLLSQG